MAAISTVFYLNKFIFWACMLSYIYQNTMVKLFLACQLRLHSFELMNTGYIWGLFFIHSQQLKGFHLESCNL